MILKFKIRASWMRLENVNVAHTTAILIVDRKSPWGGEGKRKNRVRVRHEHPPNASKMLSAKTGIVGIDDALLGIK